MAEQKEIVEQLVQIRQDIDGFLTNLLEEPELARTGKNLLSSVSKGMGKVLGLRSNRNQRQEGAQPAEEQVDPLAEPQARRNLFSQPENNAPLNESIGEADSLEERTFNLRYPGNTAGNHDETPAVLPLWIGEEDISMNDPRENISLATHLSAHLTPVQREEVRRVCERLFAQRNERMNNLWNDLQSQQIKLHFRTRSGKSFSLAGAGWQEDEESGENMDQTVAPEEPSLG
ncbi:Oidioi.mRNA.OKI2018_I69.XSR.g14634.t1.cds [Oikopleura dioica]|uniref:Oidioi.mRNA.OKI2018_I69.XSR.g14634.t1.cds n=1 Tax=Oikopleura dioica TaxID=34765 RepID=A0ABN7SAD9_OIKDI|nr:Oidioi.mRNA.OKI2018_I69.XSR.g14634.t1.cds [Oikopleura dioica]